MASRYSDHLNLPLPQDGDIIDAKDISDGFARIDAEFKTGIPIPEFGDNGNWKIKGVDTGRPYVPKKGIDFYTDADKAEFAQAASGAAVSQVNAEMQQLRADASTSASQATTAQQAAVEASSSATTAAESATRAASEARTAKEELLTVKNSAETAAREATTAASEANSAKSAAASAAQSATSAAQEAATAAANANAVANGALATRTTNGLMSALDKVTLDELNQTPTIELATQTTNGLMSAGDKSKVDKIPESFTYQLATSTTAGTMSPTDKVKLTGIAEGATKVVVTTSVTETIPGKAADAASLASVKQTADAAQTKADAVSDAVGDKNLLTTTDKSTIVAAINEVKATGGSIPMGWTPLTVTPTSSVDISQNSWMIIAFKRGRVGVCHYWCKVICPSLGTITMATITGATISKCMGGNGVNWAGTTMVASHSAYPYNVSNLTDRYAAYTEVKNNGQLVLFNGKPVATLASGTIIFEVDA